MGKDIQQKIKDKRLELYLLEGKLREAKLIHLGLVEEGKDPVKWTLDVNDDDLDTIVSIQKKIQAMHAELKTFEKRLPIERILTHSGFGIWILFGFIGFFAFLSAQPVFGLSTWLIGFVSGLLLHAFAEIIRLLTNINYKQ